MREDTAAWLNGAPVEVLQCRDLRHAWPRPQPRTGRAAGGRYNMVPPGSPGIRWEREVGRGGALVLQRSMTCTAGCGMQRLETFVVRPGGVLVRTGTPRYKAPASYRRQRPDADTPLEPIDSDVLRGSIVARLYPRLRW